MKEDSGVLGYDGVGIRRFEKFGNHEESWRFKLQKATRKLLAQRHNFASQKTEIRRCSAVKPRKSQR